MARRTNLGVQIMLHLQMVSRFEGLLQNVYNYFSKSPKRHLEFTKLAKLMEPKGAKILKNVKTRSISMLNPTWHVMVEYKTLLVQMAFNVPTNNNVKANFDFFCDVQILLGLITIMPLL